jgi:5-carboxymethyl-2-hydroxymuconate isomerase
MPHLVLLCTPRLATDCDLAALCRGLADAMLAQRDDAGKPVFPPGGVRVFAYPAAQAAVADGRRDYDFCYLNLRMGRGRGAAVHQRVGAALTACAKAFFEARYGIGFSDHFLGLTVQIDEGAEVFDAKLSSIHPLFARP